MKKVIFGMLAVAGMFAATSCVNDTDLNCANGSEATVTFNVNVDQIAATRSISDGLQATQLYYEVYDENGTELVKRGETTVNNLTATVQVQLVSGVSYQAAFWAQNPDCKAYNAENLQNLTIDYSNAKNNDETMDAFFANTQFTVSGTSLSQSVTLQRPFAQVNVGASSTPSDLGITASSVVVTGYYNSINLLNGNVGALQPGELEFASNTLPTETLSVDGGDYNYLSTTYLLATPSSEIHKMVFSFTGTNEYTLTYDNTPVKRNYRTNILTDQSMDQFEFTITVEPAYGTPDNETINGELEEAGQQEPTTVTVSGLTASVSGENVNFSANYTGEITTASFICTPMAGQQSIRRRVDTSAVITVPATVNTSSNTLTAEYPVSNFAEGVSYIVTVNADGQSVTPEGSSSVTPDFTIPSQSQETTSVTDIINNDFTKIGSVTQYGDWTETATSGATYVGNTAGNYGSVQMRSTNNSGIVTTKSGGIATKVVVDWNSNTSSTGNRTLDIYGSHTPYTTATDLYSNTTQGTKIGSITCGSQTEAILTDEYEYIGLRSNNGAMYLNSINITWKK